MMVVYRYLLILLLFCSMTPVMAATVHIVSSGHGESYESALKAIQQSIKASTPQLTTKTTTLSLFSLSEVGNDDLIIVMGDEATHALSRLSTQHPIIYSFADQTALPDDLGNWAATVTAQPLSTMLKVITPLVSKQYIPSLP
jgi:ABC-type Fe3+ transport system permease subunit